MDCWIGADHYYATRGIDDGATMNWDGCGQMIALVVVDA